MDAEDSTERNVAINYSDSAVDVVVVVDVEVRALGR